MNFDSLHDFQSYCNYKDLEGIYCESCKKWLIYKETTENKQFYIISDKLEPCEECIKVRNGHYPYLSNFRMFKKACNKRKDKTLKQEILNLFRTNGQERFIKKHILSHRILGSWLDSDSCCDKYEHKEITIIKNKFKDIPPIILEYNFKDEFVGEVVALACVSNINRGLIDALQQIAKIQHERPVMKFVVTKQFGTTEQKQILFNHYKRSDDLLENVSYESFWDEFGLHYIMGIEDSIFNNKLLDLIANYNIPMMLRLYDYNIHWSERAQHYYDRRYYRPKRFNVHKLGYY